MFLFKCFGVIGEKLTKHGNKIPEEFLRPQGLYSVDKVDLRKLRRLILDGKLAPCYPGREEGEEECPICFLHYPVLNNSKCCNKRVCTECFLQVQTSTPQGVVPSCPFCKVSNYTAKFVGARTAEELEAEREEEQKVVEARIREREEEVRRDQERALQRLQQQQQQPQPAAGTTENNSVPAASSSAFAGSQQPTPSTATALPGEAAPATAAAHSGQHLGVVSVELPIATGQQEFPPSHDGGGTATEHAEHRRRGNRSTRHPRNDASRRYRLADFVPNTIVDMSVSVEDINDFMLEQALYDSLAQAAAASRPGGNGPISPSQISIASLRSEQF